MAEGIKKDEGKLRYDLIPADALKEMVKVLTFGTTKYAARNWENGINYSRIFGSVLRHVWAWWTGEEKDPETGIHPLAHGACCIFFLLAYELRKMKHFDDRPIEKLIEGKCNCPICLRDEEKK